MAFAKTESRKEPGLTVCCSCRCTNLDVLSGLSQKLRVFNKCSVTCASLGRGFYICFLLKNRARMWVHTQLVVDKSMMRSYNNTLVSSLRSLTTYNPTTGSCS